ncbi:MAG: phosphotransferase [Bacteroidales bacterium]|nr:phosphotransferase [Bacteroidales bacterium]
METLRQLYFEYIERGPVTIEEIAGSGSSRRYFRLKTDQTSIIGTVGTNKEENEAFIALADHFSKCGLNVPKVLCVSDDHMCYLQQDLGGLSLFEALSSGRESGEYDDAQRRLLLDTMAALARFQIEGGRNLDFSCCYPQKEFDAQLVSFDLNYFKYCFLKAYGPEFNEVRLEADFKALSEYLLQDVPDAFMVRDFQARNVMLVGGKPYFIDFQGGRRGPLQYDVASFVWQARAGYPKGLREEMVERYLDALELYITVDRGDFRKRLRHFVLFRTLQVLGAYGFRGCFERKPHFLKSIPFALRNLKELLEEPFEEYPYLSEILLQLVEKQCAPAVVPEKSRLEVEVYSFSYKKGIPQDASGNGGGYVFDCRGVENPGRYEQYKQNTGLDANVKAFLDAQPGMRAFLDNVYSLADAHIRRYMERDFTHLMFCFGCTGGQHRSVYSAQHLAEYIAAKYPVKVRVIHREQLIETEL